jgi:hypothetical protein
MDAITSIKVICYNDFEFVSRNVGNLLENLCPLFINRDYKIREAASLLFKTILTIPNIKDKNIFKPFYELIDIHLNCAMTHFIEKIKYSSLKLLDILIENLPDFLILKPYKIFDNFLDQISIESPSSKKLSLRNDPCRFTSTQNWRYNVLKRIYTMMNIIFQKTDDQVDNSTQKTYCMDNSNIFITNRKSHSFFKPP